MKLVPVFYPTVFWAVTITLSTTVAFARRKWLKLNQNRTNQPALIRIKSEAETLRLQRVKSSQPQPRRLAPDWLSEPPDRY